MERVHYKNGQTSRGGVIEFQPFFDTLIFFGNGILHRAEHIARTHATFQYLRVDLPLGLIEDWYQNFEDRFLPESDGAIFKLTFTGAHAPSVTSRPHERLTTIDLHVVHDFQYTGGNSRYKWSDRAHWEKYRHLMPLNEQDILTVSEDGHIIECSRFNVFVFDPVQNIVRTPSDESGCLDGVLRRHVLNKGQIYIAGLGEKKLVSAVIPVGDLKEQTLFAGNSIRGILPVTYSGKKVYSGH